jgi:tetratricopeptide (TPR) repeat protein
MQRRVAANPYEVALALGRLARVAVAKSDLDEALELYGQAQALQDQAGAIEDMAKSQHLRARIYLARKEPRKALAEIEKTVAIIEQQRLRIAKCESRAQYFACVHEYYALYIRVLMALDRNEPDRKYAKRAIEASERSKVRALLDELANAPQAVNCDDLLEQAGQPEAIFAPAETEDARPDGLVNTEAAAVLSVEQIQGDGGGQVHAGGIRSRRGAKLCLAAGRQIHFGFETRAWRRGDPEAS